MKRDFVERPLYVNRIRPYLGERVIKVLSGQRRVGKSYLLYGLIDEIERIRPEAQIIYVNKDLYEFDRIRTCKDLLDHIEASRNPAASPVVVLDEVQDIDDFEYALRDLEARGNTEVICTGSNSGLLSGELSTKLSGRYVEIKVYGLGYEEFLRFHGMERSRNALSAYLRFGGMPYLRNLELQEEVVFGYLRNVVDAILLKDVVRRYGIRRIDFLKRLSLFLADNIGSIVSARSISNYLKSQNTEVGHTVVLNYLSHICNAFLVYAVPRESVRGRKIFEVGEKYYYGDLGIRNCLVGFRMTDVNKLLENAVFMHLQMAGYEVHVGRLDDLEIDFVCHRRGERMYVQVAYLIPDGKVRDREFGNLLRIRDNYDKYVVSMDEGAGGSYKGIRHVHAEEFLYALSSGNGP